MSGIKVFWTEPTGKVKLFLRRYKSSTENDKCPGKWGYHNGHLWLGEFPERKGTQCDWDPTRFYSGSWDDYTTKDDPRWQMKCDECEYTFTENDEKQVFQEHIYRRPDTGEEYTLDNHVPGMMWDAWWCGPEWRGSDGICLTVVLPNGNEWMVDSIASNCDSLCKICNSPANQHKYADKGHYYEDGRPHKCWVRHGDPRTSNVHVDKNGITCGAGAGSIVSGNYHGFLQNDYLI